MNRQEVIHSDKPLEVAHLNLTLPETYPITGHEKNLSSLFYEYYRSYIIYSTT
ncbi:MAG: hypothetical protein ACYDER_01005 [Ktedonobacteraceae bacterium]